MVEFKISYGSDGYVGVHQIPSGPTWGYAIDRDEHRRRKLTGPHSTIVPGDMPMPAGDLTEAATAFARAQVTKDGKVDP